MENSLSILIKKASLRYDRLATEILDQQDLTAAQFRTLKYLMRIGEPVPQRAIELAFGMSNPTVTGILQKLERKGFIDRVLNPNDKRSKLVALSPSAIAQEDFLRKLGKEIDAQMAANLTEEQEEALIDLLKELIEEE